MSGVTDCYQPVERKLELTRGCLKVLAECRNPVVIITKNFLVTRDMDLLTELARHRAVSVCVSVTTLDAELARVMEPRTSSPRQRLAAIQALAEAGVPVGGKRGSDNPGADGPRDSADCAGGGGGRGDVRGLHGGAAAVCGEGFVRAMAGSA